MGSVKSSESCFEGVAMKESEYILVSDLQRLRIITTILKEIHPDWAKEESQGKFAVARRNLHLLLDEAFALTKVDTSEEE
jgi:hypothetical protein